MKVAALSVVSDLNDKISSLSEDRNTLEREAAKMQVRWWNVVKICT